MPDSSIMLDLCNELGINVNELLSGEMIQMENYNKKAEENLLELKNRQESTNKNLLVLENIIGYTCSISFLVMIFTAGFAVSNIIWRIALICIATIIFIIGITFALKIEKDAGYYECQNCYNKYIPNFSSVMFAMHLGRTRYMKCPKCGKKTWNKKVLTK